MVHATTPPGEEAFYNVDLTLEKFKQRRVKAGRLNLGISAVSDSDMFKAPCSDKPLAKNWDSHFSHESNRPPCILKQAANYLKNPGLISLGGGLPSSEYFPISEITMKVPVPPNFSEKSTDIDSTQVATIGKYDTKEGISEFDLSLALNYGQAMGSPQMMRWITEHTELLFNPPYADWHVCQTVGSTGALEQAIRMLCDKDRNDSAITDQFTFATAVETFAPQGIQLFGIKMDEEGLLPGDMDELLSSWDEASRGKRKPHVLYSVPTGQNPSGATQSLQRRREIYAVCQKHDIYIIEDEPYYFLQMKPYNSGTADVAPADEDIDNFLTGLVPSYLTFDVDGRVLRMDSFSKVLIPGSRMGWITASKQVVQRYLRHAEVANQGPNGVAQVILWKLLDETWGHKGYLRWLIDLRSHYTRRRNMLLAACEDHLPRDIVTWTPPAAGMFLWLKLDHTKHPDYQNRSMMDIEEEIFHHAIDNGVLFARGSWFRAEPQAELEELFFRITYASASEEDMSTAVQRLSVAIKKSFKLE